MNVKTSVGYINWKEEFQSRILVNGISKFPARSKVDEKVFEQANEPRQIEQIDLRQISDDLGQSGNQRYIKLDPSKYVSGNIVDSFGFVDSFLENNLALVIAPNMTEIEVGYSERFSRNSERFLLD